MLAALIAVNVSATHLLSASLMSAPASLACAKLLYPGKFSILPSKQNNKKYHFYNRI